MKIFQPSPMSSPLPLQKRMRGSELFVCIFMLVAGCSRFDPMWKNIDIEASLHSKDALPSSLAFQNVPSDTKNVKNAVLVCNVRNRTKMRVLAKLQYRDARNNTSDIEFLCSEFNSEKWTMFATPVQVEPEELMKLGEGIPVKLKPIKIETK